MASHAGSTLAFQAWGDKGGEPYLWTEAAGCRLLADLWPSGDSLPNDFTSCGNRVYFTATAPAIGTHLYSSDGSSVVLLRTNRNGSSLPGQLMSCNNRLFFTAVDNGTDTELFVADPVTNTVAKVADLYPGPVGSDPGDLTCFQGKLYFSAT